MTTHNPQHQMSVDGPLTPQFRARIDAVRSARKMSLTAIGQRFGVSGAFISTLLRSKNPASVRSVHVPRFAQALEHLEVEAGIRPPTATSGSQTTKADDLTVEELIRALYAKGFEATLRPISRTP